MSFPVLGIPSAADVPSQSQSLIQSNFNNIVSWGAVDHITYGSTNNGTHNQVTFVGATTPVPTPSGTVGVLTSILDSNNASQLAFINKLTTAQLTGNLVNDGTSATIASEYTVATPWGIVLKFGITAQLASGSAVTLISPFPNSFLGVVATLRLAPNASSAIGALIVALSKDTFNYSYSIGGPQNAYFFAWGN